MKKRDDIIKITIDSPAAAGAGTQAKLIGKHYNLLVLDTGRCYRYVAYTKITEPSKYNYFFLEPSLVTGGVKNLRPQEAELRRQPDILV